MVVATLKQKRIRLAEFTTSKESFICLNASSCNKPVAMLGSINTICTSKLLIQRVSTSASWWGIITLFGLTGGKDMVPSIGLVSSCLLSVLTTFTWALTVAALKSFFYWRFD